MVLSKIFRTEVEMNADAKAALETEIKDFKKMGEAKYFISRKDKAFRMLKDHPASKRFAKECVKKVKDELKRREDAR